jgi:DNA-binding NtrC family response regulator
VIRTLLQRGLGRAGYEVLVAADGAEALEVFAGRPDIACVLVALTMPGMAGDDVLVAMRAQRPELPAVVMSGFTDAALSSRLGAMHRTVFRDKPFAVRDVADLVRGLLGPAASGV